ncbi:hypothetical protein LCGC14_2656510, partial [marine sediment metagenome]
MGIFDYLRRLITGYEGRIHRDEFPHAEPDAKGSRGAGRLDRMELSRR